VRPPVLRIDGTIIPQETAGVFQGDMESVLEQVATEEHRAAFLKDRNSIAPTVSPPGTIPRQRAPAAGTMSFAFRLVPFASPPSISWAAKICKDLVMKPGPGSGNRPTARQVHHDGRDD